MSIIPCDSLYYINEAIKSLSGFRQLVTERSALMHHNPPLKHWVILGKFSLANINPTQTGLYRLSTRPNHSTHKEASLFEVAGEIPPVLPDDELMFLLNLRHVSQSTIIVTRHFELPNDQEKCPHCDQGWNIHNCDDYSEDLDTYQVDLSFYAGQTFKFAYAQLETRRNLDQLKFDFIHQNNPFRNNQKMSLSSAESYKTLVVPGDKVSVSNVRHSHKACLPIS